MSTLSIFAPAKLNLFLAITGRRADGFHELVSVVAPLEFGDTLRIEAADGFSLTCDDPAVPVDETNLVLKAARAFAAATKWSGGARFVLEKRVPMGAGLGGGSSDAVAALRGLNQLAAAAGARGLSAGELAELAAQLGSDCPLFLHDGPVAMRGRGERVAVLPPAVARRLRGQRVLVFKPAFAIPTPWAYAQLAAAAPKSYLAPMEAEARLAQWIETPDAPVEALLLNTMEPAAFGKFLALPVLFEQLQRDFGVQPRMSGSGSGCFVLLRENLDVRALREAIRAAWGDSAVTIETRLA